MLTDGYGFALSTPSLMAGDAYVEGCTLMLTLWPGAGAAFAHATAADPSFALAHLGTAQVAAATGDAAAAQASLAAARASRATLTPRESSQLGFFSLFLCGQSDAALEAARDHLADWPRDAVVMNYYGTILGLISTSGRSGAKRMQVEVMDAFAREYGADDWWFLAHHAMALSEMGRGDEALAKAERSLAIYPRNAFAAHSRGHIAYESDDTEGGRAFLGTWLADYPRDGLIHGHLAWHVAIAELAAGNEAAAFQIYTESIAPGTHFGPPRMQIYDAVQFLWRWELAGNARDHSRWHALQSFARKTTPEPRPANAFSDLHTALALAVANNPEGLNSWLEQTDEWVRAGRYPGGPIVPEMSRGLAAFARGDYAAAIAKLAPLLEHSERLGGGSRAQHDLIELTVLRACLELGRVDEFQTRLIARRHGPATVPVAHLH